MLQMMDTKFIETCKVELANNILKFTIQNHVSQTYQPISFAILSLSVFEGSFFIELS